jgi:cytochrome c6
MKHIPIFCTGVTFAGMLVCSSFVKQQSPAGKELFQRSCARCHGSGGTRHFLGAKDLQKSKIDDTAIIQIIQNGKRLMPAYKKKLSAEEISLLGEYIKKLRR